MHEWRFSKRDSGHGKKKGSGKKRREQKKKILEHLVDSARGAICSGAHEYVVKSVVEQVLSSLVVDEKRI